MSKRLDEERRVAMSFNPLISTDDESTIIACRVALTFVETAIRAIGERADNVEIDSDTMAGLSSVVATINAALSLSA